MTSALGAILLAISVFLPWYGLSFTSGGLNEAQQVGEQVASQFGNSTLQSYMAGLHERLAPLVGHQFTAVSAHQILKDVGVILLILAGVAIVLSLLQLARTDVPADSAGSPMVLLGVLAAITVIYRMVDVPDPQPALLSFSLREGAWLALVGSVMVAVGGSLLLRGRRSGPSQERLERSWSDLSGWTPET